MPGHWSVYSGNAGSHDPSPVRQPDIVDVSNSVVRKDVGRLRLTVALIRQGSWVRSRRGSVSGNHRQEDFEREWFVKNLHAR